MGSSSAVSTIVEKWREHPPSSYSLKIHSFFQLENSTASSDDKYQSRLFSSGGYNWRLIVYPKGNKKDNGTGFISMYVELDSKSLMVFTPPTEVFAELRFYVYNKKENKYFTIQEDFQISNIFSMGGLQWVLKLYPKGASRVEGKWLSLFLTLAGTHTPKADERIFVQANLRVLNPLGSNHTEHKMTNWYEDQNLGWGWDQFLSLAELRKVYLDKEDALNVEAEFKVVSTTKYSPIT